MSNTDKAFRAARILDQYQLLTGTESDNTIRDLLTDLMHFRNHISDDFETDIHCARIHFEEDLLQTKIEKAPDVCPDCMSAQVEGKSIDIEGLTARQKCYCLNCEAQWEDVYRYDQTVRIETGEKSD